MSDATPQPPGPFPPRQVSAPTDDSTGDAEIDEYLAALADADEADLDAQIEAGQALHDVLRNRLAGEA